MNRWTIATGLLLASTLTFGAFEAAQGRSALRAMDCPEQGNWCATSRGGDRNCNDCCNTVDTSFCSFYDEDPSTPPIPQGCICG